MTVDLVLNRDIPEAIVTVGFYDGSVRCGSAFGPQVTGAAGGRESLSISTVYLRYEVDEGDGSPKTTVQPCQIPATTTRIVVEVWGVNRITPIRASRSAGV